MIGLVKAEQHSGVRLACACARNISTTSCDQFVFRTMVSLGSTRVMHPHRTAMRQQPDQHSATEGQGIVAAELQRRILPSPALIARIAGRACPAAGGKIRQGGSAKCGGRRASKAAALRSEGPIQGMHPRCTKNSTLVRQMHTRTACTQIRSPSTSRLLPLSPQSVPAPTSPGPRRHDLAKIRHSCTTYSVKSATLPQFLLSVQPARACDAAPSATRTPCSASTRAVRPAWSWTLTTSSRLIDAASPVFLLHTSDPRHSLTTQSFVLQEPRADGQSRGTCLTLAPPPSWLLARPAFTPSESHRYPCAPQT